MIDLKVEDDMEKILAKIDSKFQNLENKIEVLSTNMQLELKHMNGKIGTVYWVFGLSSALLAILIGLLSILK